jgi:MOSC domain-containing protein YiiM
LRAVPPIWRTMTAGLGDSILEARPEGAEASAVEHAASSRAVLADIVHAIAGTERTPVPPAAAESTLQQEVTAVEELIAVLQPRAAEPLTDPQWLLIERAVHATTHHLREAGRGLHALGAGAPHQRGRLVQVSASNGGVPKHALKSAKVDGHGVVGDEQAERIHHGRPLQALCLWSEDVIHALRTEGHPVYAGAAGENLTLAGIDWATIRPGVRLAVGSTLVEISAFATPCAKNAQWFVDGKFRRIDQHANPGWSRAYAWVVEGGEVAPGDEVVVEP